MAKLAAIRGKDFSFVLPLILKIFETAFSSVGSAPKP